MAPHTVRQDRHERGAGLSRRALLGGIGSAAGLGILGHGRRAGAQWVLPQGNVNLTFWDSTSALKTKLYTTLLLPSYKQLRPNYTVKYESITTGNLLAEAPGSHGDRHRAGDLRARRLVLPDLLRQGPPRSNPAGGVRLQDAAGAPGQLSARQPRGDAVQGQGLRPAGLRGVPQSPHQQPAVPGGGTGPGEGRAEDLGRGGAPEQGPDEAEGRPGRPEGVRVPLRRRALDGPDLPSPPVSSRRRGP